MESKVPVIETSKYDQFVMHRFNRDVEQGLCRLIRPSIWG